MTPTIDAANQEAVARLLRARPAWTAVLPAREAIGLEGRAILHAGPPIEWKRMCAPMRGAVVAAILFEDWASTPAKAVELADAGGIAFAPCHSRGAVGPMTGVISPSLPILVVEDKVNGTRAGSYIGEGMGPQARFGAFTPEVLTRLRWIRDCLAPAFQRVLEREGPIDLVALMAQALAMGDEMHMRNAAATALLAKQLAAPLAAAIDDREQLQAVLRFMTRDNDQFFLTWAMAAAKAAAMSIDGLPGCTIVSTMARNGVEFGIRVAGLGERWFTGPAPVVAGSFFPGFGAQHANPDIGDSAIMETYGLGGMAMAGSAPVVRVVGAASFGVAIETTRRMGEIAAARNPVFAIGALNWEGSPTGIDIRRVVQTGIVPSINTAIAHREFGVGRMIGAGISVPPMKPFVDALIAFAEARGGQTARLDSPAAYVGPRSLLDRAPSAINIGIGVFSRELGAQGVPATQVDWRPPAGDARVAGLLEVLEGA